MPDFLPEQILVTDDEPAVEPKEPKLSDVLSGHLSEQRRLNEEFLREIARPVRHAPLQEEIAVPGLTLDGLPDPAHDVQGFYKGLNERLGARDRALEERIMSKAARVAGGQADLKTTIARVADDIREANPDLRDSWIDYASVQVANQLKAKGLDPAAEILRDPNGIGQMVLDYAENEFLPGDDTGDTQPAPRREATRTAGLRGGGPRLPRPPKQEERHTTFVDELKAEQSALRLY